MGDTVKATFNYPGGYKTGSERGDTSYADKGEEVEMSSEEFDRLSNLTPPAVSKAGEAGPTESGIEGDAVFNRPDLDPAGRDVNEPRTDDEFASATGTPAATEEVAVEDMSKEEMKAEADRQGIEVTREDGDDSKEPTKDDYRRALSSDEG